MVTHPDPAVLYPDIAARGSLALALRAVAREHGFSLAVTGSPSDPLRHAAVESALPHRNALSVSAWAVERAWSIRGEESFQRMALVEGRTEELAQVALAARAWHEGAPLDDVRRAAPFVEPTGRFEVPDHDPVRLTESEWRHLRTEAGGLDHHGAAYRALVEAAYAEPELRGLYPFTSHWVLRFSSSTRPRLSVVGPCVLAYAVDRYAVSADFLGEHVLATAATAHEAVTAAVRHLPPGLGPVTRGADLS